MLILPSVGASVTRIVLNESGSAAKLTFDDGTTTIIRTQNTPNKKSLSTIVKTPNSVVKKKIVKKVSTEGVQMKHIRTHQGPMTVPVMHNPQQLKEKALDVVERAKKRAAMLEQQTMDASAKMAMGMDDGQEISVV